MTVRITLTAEQAKAVILAIASMEGDDDQELLAHLAKVEDKIRAARRKAAK